MARRMQGSAAVAARRQGRPSAVEIGIGRRKLIDAALQVLRTVPLDQLTASQVARAAGGDRALVRYYFGTLSALIAEALEEALEKYSAELYARLAQASSGPGSPALRLRRRVIEFVRFQLENPATHRLFNDQIVNAQTPWGRRIRDRNWKRAVAGLNALIAEGRAAGEFRPDVDARLLAIAIVGLSAVIVRATAVLKVLSEQGEDLAGLVDAYAELAADLVTRGIAPRRSTRQASPRRASRARGKLRAARHTLNLDAP